MNQKAEIKELSNKILAVTMEMKDKFPEVYKYLSESSIFDFSNNKTLSSNDFKKYLNTIESQLNIMTTL